MTDMPRTGALTDIRVVDLSRVLAGPLCGQMLADHGADVVKVEPPDGDETRGWGPPFVRADHSAYFDGLNRNKRNVSIDLRTEDGQALLRRMLEDADVVIENFKAGTLERWGLADEVIAERFPRLIHCRITGYGVDGPLGGAPGYDAVLQALSGLMSINGEPDGPAMRIGIPLVDIVTSLNAMNGILLALHARESTGRGQLIDLALLDNAVSILHPHAGKWFASGEQPVRTGVAHPTICPYETFECVDGPFFIGAGNDRQFRSLVAALGASGLVEDPRFHTNADRLAHAEELRVILGDLVGAISRDDLAGRLRAAGVPSGAVNHVGEALAMPQVLHREMVVERDGYRSVGIPVKMSATPGSVRFGPRPRGADTDEVLTGFGIDPVEVARLRDAGVVSSPDGRP
ncbi:CaiB/BaiF CoA-transferase family protein [Dietzia sp. CH92]|uniref:CaiB/BaiF CoA transferase family protein n=1 Tax=Dietzia sp. CH92 TaxID=3051823 RepID=UPI0028D1C674|nr:CaiB/BaiF CoA-transferase family protein [Dietzia sp. CH92]